MFTFLLTNDGMSRGISVYYISVLISYQIKIIEYENMTAYGLGSFESSRYCHHLQCRKVSIKLHNVMLQKNITLPENSKSNFHTWFHWVLFTVKFISPPNRSITLTSKGIKVK
jgi:hypothetical protein